MLEDDGVSRADLYKFHVEYARRTRRVQRKSCLVVYGQIGSAVRKHGGHSLTRGRGLRHVLDKAIRKVTPSGILPNTKGAKDQDPKRRTVTSNQLTLRS